MPKESNGQEIVCVHAPKPWAGSSWDPESKTNVVMDYWYCARCKTMWRKTEPEPRVVMLRIEDAND